MRMKAISANGPRLFQFHYQLDLKSLQIGSILSPISISISLCINRTRKCQTIFPLFSNTMTQFDLNQRFHTLKNIYTSLGVRHSKQYIGMQIY
jgi:hypothetical protein